MMISFLVSLTWAWLTLIVPASATTQTDSATKSSIKQGSVIYGVVPPLFGREGFRAVTQRLDHLDEMGVDIIWMTPINQSDDPSLINYAVTDYEKIRPDFGTEKDLQDLVAGAHQRGIKVFFDFIANHTSHKHPWFTDAQTQGPSAATWNYYQRNEDGEPVHYFDWWYLPNLNFDNTVVRRRLTNAMLTWMKRFSPDGYRFDAAWGPQERAPDFWAKTLKELREHNPHFIALAEASARSSVYLDAGFDLTYDWTHELGKWSWEKAFKDLDRISLHLKRALSNDFHSMQRTVRFINNNDTGLRFITRHGIGLTRVATVLLHTVPGVPIVFTGDEVGAEYEPYEDPPVINWQDKRQLTPLYKRLAELREVHPALHSGDFRVIDVQSNKRVFSFVRRHGKDLVWVVLNFGGPARIRFEGGPEMRALRSQLWTNALDGRPLTLASDGTLPMKGHSAYVMIQRVGK